MTGHATPEAIVRQIDHVFVPLEETKAAFVFLTEVLKLPEVYPFQDWREGFLTGAVSLGNVWFEVMLGNFPHGRPRQPARITGIAFEPATEIDELMSALESRGIGHGPPMTANMPGTEDPLFTNVGFDLMEGTFVSKFHFDVAARRQQLKDELDARGGGALKVVEAVELVIGTRDRERSIERWSRLLDPFALAADDSWSLGGGPAIRLVPSSSDAVEQLVLRVRSFDEARNGAAAAQIEVEKSGAGLAIAPEELGGLVLELHE